MGKSRRWLCLGLFGAYLALRLFLTTTPGYRADVGQYKLWAYAAAQHGLANLYATSDFDYPPLYGWFLWAIGKAYGLDAPDAITARGDSTLLTALVKTPPLLFDLALAGALVALARARRRREGGPFAPRDLAPAAAYLLNPAVLFDTGHWGQPDSIHAFFVVAAFAVVCGPSSRAWLAWPLLALGALMKPLAAPFFPLLLGVTWFRHGWRGTLAGIGGAAATTLLVFAPFFLAEGVAGTLARIVRDLDARNYTSVNAHNLWWMVGPWRSAATAWLGPFSAKQVGLALILAVEGAILLLAWRVHRSRSAALEREQVLALAGLLAFGFFMVSTHMHENHAFAAIPLLLAALAAAPIGTSTRRELAWLAGAVSLGVLLNELPHDMDLRERWPFALGGVADYVCDDRGRMFHVGQFVAGWIGTLVDLAVLAALTAWAASGGIARLPWRSASAQPRAAEPSGPRALSGG